MQLSPLQSGIEKLLKALWAGIVVAKFFCDLFLGFQYIQDNPTLTLVEFNTKLKNASAKVFPSLKPSLLSRKQVDET